MGVHSPTPGDSSGAFIVSKEEEEILENCHIHQSKHVIDALQTHADTGLTGDEARTRLRLYGPNELAEEEETPLWRLVMGQFEDRLVQMLLVASVVSFFLACLEERRLSAFMEPAVILLILVANAVVGVVQESGAEKAIEVSLVSPPQPNQW